MYIQFLGIIWVCGGKVTLCDGVNVGEIYVLGLRRIKQQSILKKTKKGVLINFDNSKKP